MPETFLVACTVTYGDAASIGTAASASDPDDSSYCIARAAQCFFEATVRTLSRPSSSNLRLALPWQFAQAMQPFETIGSDSLVTATGGKGGAAAKDQASTDLVWPPNHQGKKTLFEATKLGA